MNCRIGIVGAGQLAQMLCEAAKTLGLKTIVLAQDKSDCAVAYADDVLWGSTGDRIILEKLFASCDRITFENDFLPYETWSGLDEKKTAPSLSILKSCSNKIEQRAIATSLGIRCPQLFMAPTATLEWSDLRAQFPNGFVAKWTKGGYDGKGVWIETPSTTRTINNHEQAFANFMSGALTRGALVFVEERIDFDCEVALLIARRSKGDRQLYPLVVSEQKGGICYRIVGPATQCGLPSTAESLAQEWIQQAADFFDYTGVLAMELFWTGRELVFNEWAPRVHNSGHYSQDGFSASQFENHLRAVADLPLIEAAPLSQGFFGMLNILGRDRVSPTKGHAFHPTVGHFHWYNKAPRPGRKLGHINFSGFESQRALVNAMVEVEEQWSRL